MIQNILTPIDGSTHAQAALELSIDLALKYDAQIVLLHIGFHENQSEELYNRAKRELEQAESAGQETGVDTQRSHHIQVLEYMGQMLLRDAHELAESKGVKRVETAIDYGEPGDCILHYAKQRSADLIVMGSRGFGKIKEIVLGSVSHKVFHLANCSCVTVHSSDEQPSLGGIKKILVPTDGSEQANKAVDLASDIAANYGAKLELLYVTTRGPSLKQLRDSIDMDQLSVGAREEIEAERHPVASRVSNIIIPPVISKEAAEEIGEQVLERGRQAAVDHGVANPKLVLLHSDEPARAITGAARRDEVDMIAMGSRGLSGVEGVLAGSVSYKVSHSVPCSCMIVR